MSEVMTKRFMRASFFNDNPYQYSQVGRYKDNPIYGKFDYGYLGDAEKAQLLARGQTKISPFNHDPVSKTAIATGIEAGCGTYFLKLPNCAGMNAYT